VRDLRLTRAPDGVVAEAIRQRVEGMIQPRAPTVVRDGRPGRAGRRSRRLGEER